VHVAGIAWSGEGFGLALLDERGDQAAAVESFPAGQLAALIARLVALDRSTGGLVCVVDSTNGMVDGGLLAAGLRVHRADPWQLPDRSGLGSVDAGTLARAALPDPDRLPRLTVQDGSLTGRSADHERCLAESEEATAALARQGRCLTHGRRSADGPVVALTFDDGPNPPHTGRVLDVLERYGVPATFFCVGLHASGHPEELARMAEAGHRLANHTWSHPFLPDLSIPEFAAQLERTDEAIAAAAGAPPGPSLFRPPYGSRTPELLRWLAGQPDGPGTVLWDVEAQDWAMPGVDAIIRGVLAQAQPGSVILLHDGGGDRSQTAEALPAVIEGLLARGYRFVRIDELPADDGSR
jgi:peptidoglycan/xylan/chitin deacetylase (PgdA/CDA1 family)